MGKKEREQMQNQYDQSSVSESFISEAESEDNDEAIARKNQSKMAQVHKISGGLHVEDFSQINKLGEGTYGVVIGARYKKVPNLYIALKGITKKGVFDYGLPADIFNEEKILKMCTEGFNKNECLNVCTFVGSWMDHNRIYFAMEHLPNRSLYHHCAENPDSAGPQDLKFCQYYMAEIARGVIYLNKNGIIHREMKLENVALDINCHCRLIDFGMVKLLDPNNEEDLATSFVGTPNYMAPEIIFQEDPYSYPVDWWAMGVMLFEMHASDHLFSGGDEDELFTDICFESIEEKLDAKEHMHPEVRRVLEELLDREPEKRLAWTPKSNPLKVDPFFRNGEKLVDTEQPPIQSSYVVETDKESKTEANNIYQGRGTTNRQRVEGKQKNFMPVCDDVIDEEDNAEFEGFGAIMDYSEKILR